MAGGDININIILYFGAQVWALGPRHHSQFLNKHKVYLQAAKTIHQGPTDKGWNSPMLSVTVMKIHSSIKGEFLQRVLISFIILQFENEIATTNEGENTACNETNSRSVYRSPFFWFST